MTKDTIINVMGRVAAGVCFSGLLMFGLWLAISAVIGPAAAQRSSAPTVVGGQTSAGVPATMLTDSDGTIHVTGTTTGGSISGGTAVYSGTGATVTTLSATSGTALTANTIFVGQLSCYNVTAGAVSINRTDTAGTQFEVSFSIPANSNYLRSYADNPEKMVGMKMWASAINSINCTVTATQ